VLLESSTESEWIACILKGLGHEVVVADPNYEPMYNHPESSDQDGSTGCPRLGEACRVGAYRAAHRTSDLGRHIRALIAVRENLVRTSVIGNLENAPQPIAESLARIGESRGEPINRVALCDEPALILA
jgi:hypothetical protein